MFASAAGPSSSTTTSPTSRTRPSRLRGLSALRNYTQNHLSLHHSQPTSPTSPSSGGGGFSRFLSGPASSGGGAHDAELRASYFGPQETDRPGPADGQSDMPRRKPVAGSSGPRTNGVLSMVTNAPPRGTPTHTHANKPESHGLTGLPTDQMPTIRFIPYQDPRANKPSLAFPATSRTLPHEDCVIRVGRYSERDLSTNIPPGIPSSAPVGFKSKVVSRRHCEFWCSHGQWYVKDVKSSSGTFLNHIRLSQPSIESRPFPVHDGDVIQLGIDFRGGEEQIFRCVKIRVECNRAWQQALNNFNKSTHKRLKALNAARADADNISNYTSECSICLMSISPCQSLFVAPCSHVWHFRCIRPILMDPKNYPQFLCPNCRAVADLEADIDEVPPNWGDEGNSSDSEVAKSTGNRAQEITHVSSGSEQEQLDLALAQSLQESLRLAEGPVIATDASTDRPEPQRDSLSRGNTSSNPNSPLPTRGPLLSAMASPTPPVNTASIALAPRSALSHSDGQFTPPGENPDQGNSLAADSPEELHHEGPLTPRNEAGPFIFDGSGNGGEVGGPRAQQTSV